MSKILTKTQQKILQLIIEEKSIQGKTPTLSEIANKIGLKNRSTIRQHLLAIEKKGFIEREERKSRGIKLKVEQTYFKKHRINGEVAAGNPLTIYQDSIDSVDLPNVVAIPKQSFLLRVKGDSLKDAYIFNGDIVIVNPLKDPADGQVVAAILNDAAVIKRYFKRKDKIELQSENPEFAPIYIDIKSTYFRVIGVVVGIYRNLERKKSK